ncbi:OmpA family protein [Williamwhitmania taraxaci]|uniref:OmpA family protein n=1 Tax=Williamwhitmania taraxaci TaxID=1640674 RepID=A0A1G6PU81_9BACT|nr:OmpA family protein [Williamwhitmania taraxaci]SDC83639.1 OmpA family protein [Williamwhitmania taraxaci]
MRILFIGFIAFACWSAFSTYVYVCKVKGLCNEQQTTIVVAESHHDTKVSPPDTVKQALIPQDLVVHFAFDNSAFEANQEASQYFDESNAYMNQDSMAKLSITGYTDAIGTDKYNQALGYRRAQSMQQYFESKGISANRISIESKGEKEPITDNSTILGRADNRRSVVTLKK